MSQMPDYARGERDGIRMAIHWLHCRAKEMNDPKAQQILNAAADSLGKERAHYAGAIGEPPEPFKPDLLLGCWSEDDFDLDGPGPGA